MSQDNSETVGFLEAAVAVVTIAAALYGAWRWSRRPRERARRLVDILDPLGSQVAALGQVMLMVGPTSEVDQNRRFDAIQDLLSDFDTVKPHLYELRDDTLAKDILEELRTVRTESLPRAKAALAKQQYNLENLGKGSMWSLVFAAPGGSLQYHGKCVLQLVVRLRRKL